MNLGTRSFNRARTCLPRPTSVGQLPVVAENCPDRGPVHSTRVGDRRVTLDLSTGVGYEHHLDQGVARVLSRAESRLLLLDWTRTRMPLQSPTTLWVIEAAALAAGSAHPWRDWAVADLHSALTGLLDSRVQWTDAARGSIRQAVTAAETDQSTVDGELLAAVVHQVEQALPAAWSERAMESVPAPQTIAGCGEVEWDRVTSVGVDLGEHGLRSKVLGTVWTASIAQHRSRRRAGTAERLWARLVDDASGLVLDQVEMRCAEGLYAARGYVPSAARRVPTRVDLTADPAAAARTSDERRRVLWEQGWFRALFFARRGSAGGGWEDCSYRARCGGASRDAFHAAVAVSPWHDAAGGPFLAERHLRPSDLASVSQRHLSPGHDGAPPATA